MFVAASRRYATRTARICVYVEKKEGGRKAVYVAWGGVIYLYSSMEGTMTTPALHRVFLRSWKETDRGEGGSGNSIRCRDLLVPHTASARGEFLTMLV